MAQQFGQVVAWWLVKTGSQDEIRSCFESLERRYRLHGFDPPRLFYTDNPTGDKNFLTDVFSSLREGGPMHVTEQAPLEGAEHIGLGENAPQTSSAIQGRPRLVLPSEPVLLAILDDRELQRATDEIRASLRETRSNVVGLDLEWDFPVPGGTRQPIALIQVATQTGHTWLFHVAKWNLQVAADRDGDDSDSRRSKRHLPQPLADLLEDRAIIKAGNNIRNDRTLLCQDFDVHLSDHHEYIDLSTHAMQNKLIAHRLTLEDLAKVVLKRTISKDNQVRRSQWSRTLSHDQVQYAAIDAYASVLVYAVVAATGNPIDRPAPAKNELVTGQEVHLYTHDHTTKLATGTIVVDPERFQEGKVFGNSKARITATRVVVKVTEIHQQQAYLPFGDFYTNARMTISEAMFLAEHMHGDEPLVIWGVRDVRRVHDTTQYPIPEIPAGPSDQVTAPFEDFVDQPALVDSILGNESLTEDSELQFEDEQHLERDTDDDDDDNDDDPAAPAGQDVLSPAALEAHKQKIRELLAKPCSRVKGDVFHVLHGIAKTLKQSHGAFSTFMKRLRCV